MSKENKKSEKKKKKKKKKTTTTFFRICQFLLFMYKYMYLEVKVLNKVCQKSETCHEHTLLLLCTEVCFAVLK